ncbi:hypothetical protein TR67_07200 [Pseudomonas deceptionensis]|nr:hypothetical protein TR67_07200 [Pseudomonas deceptionensis]
MAGGIFARMLRRIHDELPAPGKCECSISQCISAAAQTQYDATERFAVRFLRFLDMVGRAGEPQLSDVNADTRAVAAAPLALKLFALQF